jgi:hypothetical protein
MVMYHSHCTSIKPLLNPLYAICLLLPAGFTCRWQLTPDQPDLLLSVDYRGLLPDESIVLELAPNNIIRLRAPDGGPGAVFQASVWVEHSILVSFQTTRRSTDRGGGSLVSQTRLACALNTVLKQHAWLGRARRVGSQ